MFKSTVKNTLDIQLEDQVQLRAQLTNLIKGINHIQFENSKDITQVSKKFFALSIGLMNVCVYLYKIKNFFLI